MGKGSNTTTTTSTPPQQVLDNYGYITDLAKTTAMNNPYTPYTGQTIAGLSGNQTLASDLYKSMMGDLNQYWGGAVGGIKQAMGPVDPSPYLSPYTQNVIDTTMANINKNNAIQASDLTSKGIQAGNAFGGDRLGVAQAELARNQNLASGQVIAGLQDKNYTQALAAAQTDAARKMQGAGLYGTLGQSYGNMALNNIAGIANMGAIDQATEQAKLSSDYQQWQNQIAYPYQNVGWLSGILGGMGSGMGGTSTSTAPGPSMGSQILGGLTAGAGILGSLGQAAPFFAMLKDGGRVPPRYAEGGVVLPENPETLLAQQDQLLEGERPVQMFPTGTPELPLPEGAGRVEGLSGAFHYNPAQASPEALQGLAATGRENEALGLGPFSKEEIAQRVQAGEPALVIVERTPDGVEVRAALGTPSTLPAQLEVMEKVKSPENKLAVEALQDVLAARMGGEAPPQFAAGGVAAPAIRAFGQIPGVNDSNPGLIPMVTASAVKAGGGMPIPKAEPPKQQSMQDMLKSIKDATPSLKQMMDNLRAGQPTDLTAPYPIESSPAPSNFNEQTPAAYGASSFGNYGLYKHGGVVPDYASGGKPVEAVDMGEVIDLTEDPRFILRNDNLGLGVRPQWTNPALEADAEYPPSKEETGVVPLPRARPESLGEEEDVAELPPQITGPRPEGLPSSVMAYDGAGGVRTSPTPPTVRPQGVYAPPADRESAIMNKPDLWQALISAGLGMMAGTSPYAAVNIGQGALLGVQNLNEQKKSAVAQYNAEVRAKQLAEEAQRAREALQETTRSNMAREKHSETTVAESARANRATEAYRLQELQSRAEERRLERERKAEERREKQEEARLKAERESPLWQATQREAIADKYGLKGPARERYITEGKGLKDETQLSAADKKAIMSAEDELPVIDNTIDTLTRAKELNPQAFTGAFAGTRALAGAKLPDWMVPDVLADRKGAEASREFNQLMSMESIKTMASTLKGATTDRELAQFVEILGDPSTDAATRERTINRMLTLAKRQRELAISRIRDLRGGDYYKPADKRGSAATPVLSPADQKALDWARNNPNDPRAAQIKQRLGVP